MIEHIPELIEAGISSFKIEGRMKTPLYVAMVTKAYREAIDDYCRDPELYESKKPYYLELLSQVSHRGYNTGFYFGHPDQNSQVYDSSEYIKQMNFAAKVIGSKDGNLLVEQRNKFSVGDSLYVLLPEEAPRLYPVQEIRSMDGELRESAPHAQEQLLLTAPDYRIPEGTILMKRL